jgi:hypothetical protein
MGKFGAVLGLALLAGCGNSGNNAFARRVTVDVINNGTDVAYGRAENWNGGDGHDFYLAPGGTTTFHLYVAYRLKVHIARGSDDLVLVDDFFDWGDLSEMDDRLSFTVTP